MTPRAAPGAVHPIRCHCRACTGPRTVHAPSRWSGHVEPGDLSALLWGVRLGAVAAALLIVNHYGPALLAWLAN
ncbi:MAG: hypothetical protein QM690_16040 [Sphingobium sp.]